MGPSECCQVVVVLSLSARQTRSLVLSLPMGSTVGDALAQAGWSVGDGAVGVWGRKAALDHVLKAGDRVEIYRPLQVDPKEARRQRYAARGTKPRISGNKRFKAPAVVTDNQPK